MHTFLFGFVMLDKPPMERHKANRWSRFKCLRFFWVFKELKKIIMNLGFDVDVFYGWKWNGQWMDKENFLRFLFLRVFSRL